MLVITRREGESIFIGDEIEVIIVETGSTVRLGINAPREMRITRTELIPADELASVD
jgi:carbon storage regulator